MLRAVGVGFFLAGCLIVAFSPGAAAAGRLTVAPATGGPGTPVTVSSSDLCKRPGGAMVELELDEPDGDSLDGADATATAPGAFSAILTVPALEDVEALGPPGSSVSLSIVVNCFADDQAEEPFASSTAVFTLVLPSATTTTTEPTTTTTAATTTTIAGSTTTTAPATTTSSTSASTSSSASSSSTIGPTTSGAATQPGSSAGGGTGSALPKTGARSSLQAGLGLALAGGGLLLWVGGEAVRGARLRRPVSRR